MSRDEALKALLDLAGAPKVSKLGFDLDLDERAQRVLAPSRFSCGAVELDATLAAYGALFAPDVAGVMGERP